MLVVCGQSPFHPSALRAAAISCTLFTTSLAASATALLVVLSPGSLTISTNFRRATPCIIPSVPDEPMSLSYNFSSNIADRNGLLDSAVQSIVSADTYLPPFQENLNSTCGKGTVSCSYSTTFVGPALKCNDITNQTNFHSFLNPDPSFTSPSQPFTVWNGSEYDGDIIGITILSRDILKGVLRATNCTAYSATYDVDVNLLEGSATVQASNVLLNSVLFQDNSFISAYASVVLDQLNTVAFAGPDAPVNQIVFPTSSFLVMTPDGTPTFSDTVPHFVTSLMQNVSISLLSGNINYGFSNETATNLHFIDSTCTSLDSVYAYNSFRLLVTYAGTLGVTVVIVLYGCLSIWRDGRESKLLFSTVIEIALNEELFCTSWDNLTKDRTLVHLIRPHHGKRRLVPITPTDLGPHDSPDKTSKHSKYSKLNDPFEFFTTIPNAGRWYPSHIDGRVILFVLTVVGIMFVNHAYYLYLDGKVPSSSFASEWILNQAIVSDVGIALTYTGQTFLAVAIARSTCQVFWYTIRNRGYTITQIDALLKVQTGPFTLSLFNALRASTGVPMLALLAASMSLVSIFSPGSIKIATGHKRLEECTVLGPRNLSTLTINNTLGALVGNFKPALYELMALGTYLPPINVCGSGLNNVSCNYNLQIIGPGLDCMNVTSSSNYAAFASARGPNSTNLYQASFGLQADDDLTMQVSVQTWDVKRSEYQAANCTGVIRSYFISVSQGLVPSIEVAESLVISTIHANVSQLSNFLDNYIFDLMVVIAEPGAVISNGSLEVSLPFMSSPTGGISSAVLDGNITWNEILAQALEGYAQNATLSLLSGQVSTLNSNFPDVLENVTTTCTYSFTAYEYNSQRLFLTYGIAIFATVLCTVWGSIVARRNGVKETMVFSRILRSILNERLYNVKGIIDEYSIVKADSTVEGALAPCQPHF
ncbi:hypothetical protein SCHPADRAFT_947313 [Schizopora paradoxa]|uniref:Uncharacterized protein n=1 Tax=Schizopora paradoxa TaxID=27342 RepID=A0A0H2QZM7_9AGAM|nr:hypothetical protein SCHPADRAFT_947313 [Schizopora paradoxa]